MSKAQLKRLAEKYQAYKEAKGEPLTLQEFSDLFEGLLRQFLNK